MLKKILSEILLTMLLGATLMSPFGIQSTKQRGVIDNVSGKPADFGGGPSGFEAQSASTDWWPMFRHDLPHTGCSSSWAPNTNQTLWSYPTYGAVDSSPAVAEGRVFIGSSDNKIYALDYLTGEFLWSYTTGGAVGSSPAVADGMVFVGSNDNKVYALTATTGAFVWSFPTGGWVVSSPAVADGKVFVGSYDSKVYALNEFTGALLWSYTTGDCVYSSPAVADGKVYVGSFDTNVYALDASTGAYIWNYPTHERVYSSPAYSYDYGMVYVGSVDGNVYALNALTGEKRWSYSTGQNVVSSPAVASYNVYVGSYYDNGKVWALDAYNGDLVWSRATGNFSVVSSPAVAFGKVYVGSNDFTGKGGVVIGSVYALDADTGETVWNYTTGGGVVSSPAVALGKVYVGSADTRVYAFGIPVLSAWAYKTPTIDGNIFPGTSIAYGPRTYGSSSGIVVFMGHEWSDAAKVDFTLNYGAESHPATLYVMNDYINLYLALEIKGEEFDGADVVDFNFDNDHNGIKDVGDNHLTLWAGFGASLLDEFWTADGHAVEDRLYGGSNDGAGGAYYRAATSTWNLELVYPLDSGDNDHDFSLSIGSTVGFNLEYYDNGGIQGASSWPSPTFSGMATIRIAGPPTAPPHSNADLSITRIEVTQAIQDLSNDLRLVADKATAVRVYVDIGPILGPIDVTVYLYGSTTAQDFLGTLKKSFGAPSNPNRGITTHTANFLLPMSWIQPNLILKAFVKASSASRSETNYNNNWMAEQRFEFHYTTIPWVYIVPINKGTASNPILPTDKQIADAESYFKTVYPARTVNFVLMTPCIAPGYSDGLNELLEWWYWWLPITLPLGQVYGFDSGTGGVALPLYCDGAGIASSGGGDAMSHEIDHNWGFWIHDKDDWIDGSGWGGHVPFAGPNDFFDHSWPYADGTIQEYGFDTRTMTVVDDSTFDFMTYSSPDWISPYRWEAAFDLLERGYRLSTVGGSQATIQQVGDSLMISGWLSSNGSGSLDPIFRLPSLVQSNSTPGTYALVLQDSAGNTLLTHSFKPSTIVDSEQDDPHYFFKLLPHVNGTAQVLLTYANTTILDKIVMSQHAPTVTVLSPNGGESWQPGVQTIEWMASDLDGDPLTYQVFYSTDNGTVWRPLSSGLTQTYYEVDASLIPGSPSALIKVVASDGFNIGEDSSDTIFTVTDKPPKAKILQPEDKAQFLMDDVVLLDGYGTDVDDTMLPETAYNWTSDIDGYLGNGSTLTAMLTIGTHRITFTVTDSQGNKANDTIIISVTPYFEITSVAPSKTVAGQGFLTPINVTVTNLGPITQTINVTICANMTPSAEQWDEFWSMGDVNRNGFIDDVDIALVTAAFGSHPGDPNWNPAADVNSDGVVNMKDLARLAHNYGKNIWDYFGLSPPPIGMQNVNLSIGDSKTMTFTWNTTGSVYGNYSMWAYAEPVEGETIALDYTFVDGQVVVSIPGDLDGNFAVDIYDAILLAGHFNQTPLSPSWNANVDINGDGIVDIFDAILLAKHFNQHYP